MKNKRKAIAFFLLLELVCVIGIHMTGNAAQVNTYSITVQGSYRDPSTQQIADSGGESSEALGQSMVSSVVDSTGLLELDSKGNWVMSVRFHLMDNISQVTLFTQLAGETVWTSAPYEVTGESKESKDLRLTLPGENAAIKAECYVEAMGRSVIFFVTYQNPIAGNDGQFAVLETNAAQHTVSQVVDAQDTEKEQESDGQMLTAEEVPKASLTDFTQVEGLTIGTAAAETIVQEEKTKQENSHSIQTNAGELQLILDDSFWLVLFGILFCAVFLADAIFAMLFLGIRHCCVRKRKYINRDFFSEGEMAEEEDDENLDFQFMEEQEETEDV